MHKIRDNKKETKLAYGWNNPIKWYNIKLHKQVELLCEMVLYKIQDKTSNWPVSGINDPLKWSFCENSTKKSNSHYKLFVLSCKNSGQKSQTGMFWGRMILGKGLVQNTGEKSSAIFLAVKLGKIQTGRTIRKMTTAWKHLLYLHRPFLSMESFMSTSDSVPNNPMVLLLRRS